ncbi:related to Medium-chain fatty acid ethyl ester synthase/esterase 2 [Saccharomycodes ludwigii]|uniref:Related to Medium-chain fatty acid ethyl ester synthase/esterase 2 n=1 Tax=Saccharomycodes ludwigii TaxID=36035 RepID=A0A376BA58_9ASCO|nr:hypothetical protein SCDLUD_002045 [Saccharomycodes ludwigii]KAH3902228.1 hypothetical protein SCDLUD_002045 [Saccharomycodes ludwigii]SSD61481.1 related to Medium-chain fatty acid ethyl ester synthase/esterase 2 [Saccharomycodes ludwigii]
MNSFPLLNPLHWGYNGTVTQHVSPTSVKLTLKETKTAITFNQFINEYVTGLRNGASFQLNPKLFTGILQTLYLSSADFSKTFQVFYGREVVTYSDKGISTADYVLTKEWSEKYAIKPFTSSYNKDLFSQDEKETHLENWPRLQPRTRYLTEEEKIKYIENDTRPLIVIMHGLCGGSHEPIIRSLAEKLSASGVFQVVVLNTRGCARSKISTQKLFSGFSTGDLREFINAKIAKNPDRRIYCVGFSFGATLLANYLGEEGEKCPVKAACTLCNPWDMVHAAEKMTQDFWSKTLFSKAIAQFLVRLVKVNMKELEQPEDVNNEVFTQISKHNPSTHVFTKSNLSKAKNFKNTMEFDNTYTAPCLGYESALSYYADVTSILRVPQIAVPFLVINSEDDPVVGTSTPRIIKTMVSNKNVVFCSTDLGGHLCYLDKNYDSWCNVQIANYFEKFETLIEN